MTQYKCPYCGEPLETDDAMSGKQDVCPACKKTHTVPLSNRDRKAAETQQREAARKAELQAAMAAQKAKSAAAKAAPAAPKDPDGGGLVKFLKVFGGLLAGLSMLGGGLCIECWSQGFTESGFNLLFASLVLIPIVVACFWMSEVLYRLRRIDRAARSNQ
jgi:uncharacterized Zn finger protein (UPF0148 family)